MTKHNRLFQILSVLSIVISLVLCAYILFVPTEKLNFFLVPIFLSVISILYLLRMVYFAMDIVKKISKLSFLQKFFKLIFCVVVVVCTFFAGNAVFSCATIERSEETSLLSSYDIDDELRELFPFYDSFYEAGGDDAYYGLSLDSIKQCEYIRIDNRPHTDDENSASYIAERFRSVNVFLNLKYRCEFIIEYFRNDFKIKEEYTAYTPEDKKIKFYEGDNCYLATVDAFTTIFTVELLHAKESGISFDAFVEAATEQFNLLLEIEEKQAESTVTDA